MLKLFIYPILWLSFLSIFALFKAHANEESPTTLVIVDVVDWLSPANQAMHQATVLQTILDHLNIPHQTEQVTRNRARLLVRGHKTACMPWLLKTPERLKEFQFSVPYMVENALQLVVLEQSKIAQELQKKRQSGPINLSELLMQQRPPILGIETNRSYGETTDRLLEALQHIPAIYTRTSSSNQPAELIPMLERGFIDIIIDYKVVAVEQSNELAFFPFKETEAFQLSHFACSDSQEMTKLMQSLNHSIQMLSQNEDFQQLMLHSIPPHLQDDALQYLLRAQQRP